MFPFLKRSHANPMSWDRPLTRIQLHVHLDGTMRFQTILEIAKAKGVLLPGSGEIRDLVNYFVLKEREDLGRYLGRFDIIHKCLRGDLSALERISYEFVEDCGKQGVIYAESGFAPHLLLPDGVAEKAEIKTWLWNMTAAALKGLRRGQADFGVKVNLILLAIRGSCSLWFEETLELILDSDFHGGKIVGLDIAGETPKSFETQTDKDTVNLFEAALKHGIHRTAHAECGGPQEVTHALDILHAERIGHGYSIVEDAKVYERVKKDGVHLETTPWCSLLTGAVGVEQTPHPIVQFFNDNLNVGVSTDDPVLTGTTMDDEYNLLVHLGLVESHFVRGNLNAARSCFLPETEKKELIQTLAKNYGVSAQP